MAKPPLKLTPSTSEPPAIIVALHGAGINADNPVWSGSYRKQEFAWVSMLCDLDCKVQRLIFCDRSILFFFLFNCSYSNQPVERRGMLSMREREMSNERKLTDLTFFVEKGLRLAWP
jgi:hypothetical protein